MLLVALIAPSTQQNHALNKQRRQYQVGERVVNQTIGRAASSLTDCRFTQHEPVIVTLSDAGYADLLYLWAERAAQMGWPQRVVVALDNSTYTSVVADVLEASLPEGGGACVLPFFPLGRTGREDARVGDRGATSRGARTLPVFTGLARFSVLHLLIVGGYDSITLSEMDVFWFSPPWVPLLAVTHPASLLCLDNYPAATHADNAANIGLIHLRRPHGNDGFARRFIAHVLGRWRERLLATAGAAGLVVGDEQTLLNRELMAWPDKEERTRSFALLNRSQFVNSRHLEAYGRGRYRVARPKGQALRQVKEGLPHAHLEAMLVAFHAISTAPKAKKALLRRLYAGNLTLSQFARTQWTALVSV